MRATRAIRKCRGWRRERRSNTKKDERESERNETGGWRNDGEEAMILVIASPAFYGSPFGMGRYSRDCDCAAGFWLRASAARNREPRLIKRRRAIVNDPPRLVVKDRAGISRSVSRLPRPIDVRRSSFVVVCINALVNASNAPKRDTINSIRI